MRTILVTAVLAIGGCSFGMQSIDPKWDGTTEPQCTNSPGPVIGDGLAAGLLLGVGAGAADASVQANNEGRASGTADTLAAVGLIAGTVFVVSAIMGEHTYSECKGAVAQWRLGGALAVRSGPVVSRAPTDDTPDTSNPKNDPNMAWTFWCGADGECFADEAKCGTECSARKQVWCAAKSGGYYFCGIDEYACRVARGTGGASGSCMRRMAKAQPPRRKPRAVVRQEEVEPDRALDPSPAPPPVPRGFYCTSSPSISTAGLCAREKAACESARQLAAGAVSDLAACTLVETAWCFDEQRCAPTQGSCEAQRAGAEGAPECIEAR